MKWTAGMTCAATCCPTAAASPSSTRSSHERMEADDVAALTQLANAYLTHLSPTPGGDPVARFHLDNGACVESLIPRGIMSPAGLEQSFGMMVNCLYDLDNVEAHYCLCRAGEVVRSRDLAAPL